MESNTKWISFTQENAGYMLKTVLGEERVTVYLTDLRKMWSETLTNEQLHQRFKGLNESFDFGLEECRKEVLTLTENIEKTGVVNVDKSSDTVVLGLNGKLLSFPINFQFKLALCHQEMFFTEVTLALMKTVKLLEGQNKSFCDLLVQKDREISEYNLEKGATISKKYLITEPFDVAKIENSKNVNLMLGIFGASAEFWSKATGEVEIIETPAKKLKTSDSKDTVKVYSSKSKKNLKPGINYGARE